MCVIALKLPAATLDEITLRAMWVSNPDGAGYAYPGPDGKMVINKGFMTLNELIESVRSNSKELENVPVLFHFRIRTAGQRSAENTHPFEIVGGEGVLAHNGTFYELTNNVLTGESDTHKFTDIFGEDLSYEVTEALREKDNLRPAIGTNKLAFLYADGSHVIWNESLGTWREGVWYSNTGFAYTEARLRSN